MSPVLQLFGYGKFTIDPSPFCVLGSAFINSPKHSFLPLNQFLEADRFLLDVNRSIFQKFFRRENSSRENSFPIWLQVRILRLMQKILQDSIRKEYRSETPILSSYVSPSASESSKMKFEEFCREIQFIFIHNYMDLAAVDMHRRHQCINIRSSLVNSSASAAVCTGCL